MVGLVAISLFFISLIIIEFNKQKWIRILILGLLLILATFFSEYHLIQYLFSGEQTNRLVTQETGTLLNWKGIIGVSILSFLFGHYHFHSLHIIIAISFIIYVVTAIYKENMRVLFEKNKHLITIVLSLLILSIFTTIYSNTSLLKGLPRINLRLWVVWPILWYVVFALMLKRIRNNNLKKILILVQIIWVLFLVYPKDYYGSSDAENTFSQTFIKNNDGEAQTFNNYFMVDIFDTLKMKVPDLHKHNTVSLGFVPGIALFNDLKVYDVYLSIYPLYVWQSWSKINQGELQKSGSTNNFTNKAYLISHELTGGNKKISYPAWDFIELSKNKVKYILTYDVQIEGIELVEKVSNLYLYKL